MVRVFDGEMVRGSQEFIWRNGSRRDLFYGWKPKPINCSFEADGEEHNWNLTLVGNNPRRSKGKKRVSFGRKSHKHIFLGRAFL